MIDTVELKIDVAGYDSNEPWNRAWEVERPDLFTNPDVDNFTGSNWHKWNKLSYNWLYPSYP